LSVQFLASGKFATVESDRNLFVIHLLLEDCAQGKVTGIGLKDKRVVWFDLKDLETLFKSNFEIFKGFSTRIIPGNCF
jgi:hypothetical protein